MKRSDLQPALSVVLLMAAASTLSAQRVVGRFGEAFVDGRKVVVEVLVGVPRGGNADTIAGAALRDQGARPIDSRFQLTGFDWNSVPSPELPGRVSQIYVPDNEPAGFDAQAAFANSQTTWNLVTELTFSFDDGGTTPNVCQSLVRECPGR